MMSKKGNSIQLEDSQYKFKRLLWMFLKLRRNISVATRVTQRRAAKAVFFKLNDAVKQFLQERSRNCSNAKLRHRTIPEKEATNPIHWKALMQEQLGTASSMREQTDRSLFARTGIQGGSAGLQRQSQPKIENKIIDSFTFTRFLDLKWKERKVHTLLEDVVLSVYATQNISICKRPKSAL